MLHKHEIRCVALAALVAGAICTSALAQPADQLPYFFAQRPSVFARLFHDANTRLVHGLLFGDSQETCPQGAGDQYVIDLNREFANWYGGCGATPWCQAGASFGGGQPWGEWLVRAANAPPGPTLRPYPERWLPPGMAGCTVSATNGHNHNDNEAFGWLIFLDNYARWSNPDCHASGGPYLDTRDGVYLQLMARSEPGSSELYAKIATTSRPEPYYYEQVQVAVSTSMHLDHPKQEIRTQMLGPFQIPRNRSLQAEIAGNDPRRVATLISARFVSARPRGVVFTDIAEGGYDSGTIASRHSECGPVLAKLEGDFAMIAYGANDAGNSLPMATFRYNIKKLIAFIRKNTRDDFPVIMLCDPYRFTSIPRQVNAQELLPAEAYKIALDDPNVLFVNSRRLTMNEGWTRNNYSPFCVDGVHYNSRGATVKAKAEAHTILQTFACKADWNADGYADVFDFEEFMSAYLDGLPEADFDHDHFVDAFDLLNFLDAFELGCD